MATKDTIIPAALTPGATIAFVSPSGRLNNLFPTRIARAKEHLEQLGYKIKIIFNPSLPEDDFQAAIKARCDELHTAFKDPSIKAIVCTIGGLSANELLPHLDYDLIRSNPKIFVGYSDITLLHSAIFTQAGLRTLYGPAAITSFGEYPAVLPFTLAHFLHVVQPAAPSKPVGPLPRSAEFTQEFLDWADEAGGAKALRARALSPSPAWKWLRPGSARGVLFGGCLPSLTQLAGTLYMPDFRGKLLFVETPEGDEDGKPFGLDFARLAMADLRNIGVLAHVAGLVLGRPYQYTTDESRLAFERMVVDQCYGLSFPILANVDVGHTDPMLTLPLGAEASLDSDRDEFAILEAAVV